MNNYNIIFKGSDGSIDIIENTNKYRLQPYSNISIQQPIGLCYTIHNKLPTNDTIIIQTKHCYYSIILDPLTLISKHDYLYYFLYLDNLLDSHSIPNTNTYGASIIEKTDITHMVIGTTSTQIFSNISHTSTISKKPTTQTSCYTCSKDNNFLTLFKNNNSLFASCSFLNGSNYISFCGTYESPMNQFLLYNHNDILIHKNTILEYKDLLNPINLSINFANSV